MILYFSGTGNSRYAAERIGRSTGDAAVDLFEKIRDHDYMPMYSDRPWVIVTPTYAWRIPRILQAWLEKTELSGSRDLYVVMTCGSNIGNARTYVSRLCETKKMHSRGCFPIVMPENYIAMFTAPSADASKAIICRAEKEMDRAASLIQTGQNFPSPALSLADRISSGIVNDAFYPMFVHAKKFYVKDTCISCGKCAAVCPLSNIRLEEGKPVWGDSCTHCMACICRCPAEAIEYGKRSRGQVRYVCPGGERG